MYKGIHDTVAEKGLEEGQWLDREENISDIKKLIQAFSLLLRRCETMSLDC
jgi:hypothetical protein